MQRSWKCLLVLSVSLLSVSCFNRKANVPPPTQVAAQTDAASTEETEAPAPSIEPEPVGLPAETLADPAPEETPAAPDPAAELIKNATLRFEEGKEDFLAGELDTGRAEMLLALSALRDSGFDFYENPSLEATYYNLLEEKQALELDSLLDPEQMGQVELLATPLDEFARVDIFDIEIDPALEATVADEIRDTRYDFPVVVNKAVLQFLDYYQNRGRKVMEDGLRRSGEYMDVYRETFRKHGLPLDLIYMAHVESLFKPHAYSRAHAKGVWQFVSGTGRQYGLQIGWWVDERSNVEKSTDAAARHLKDLYLRFGDWYLALASYNAGAGRVIRNQRRYGNKDDYWTMVAKRRLPRDTRTYVPAILAAIIIHRNPERFGFDVEPHPPVRFDIAELEFQVDLAVVAESIGVDEKTLTELNPELLRRVSPFDSKGYRLRVPVGMAEMTRQKLTALPADQRLRIQHHRVRRGETLWEIAKNYSTSIRAIVEVNRIKNPNRLRLNQDLVIPISPSRAQGDFEPNPKTTPAVYTVRRGDSLYKIARRYGLRVSQITQWNGLRTNQTIFPGQKLKLKSPAVTATSSNRR